MTNTKKLTLEDIGKLAGVSRSTVSRVINNQPGVKERVRQRVQEVIKETGFIPNPAARSLAVQRSGIIGLVFPRSITSLFGDPYFSRIAQGISQACYSNGYILSMFLLYSEQDEQILLPRIGQRSFLDGVIVQATITTDPIIPHLQKSGMPFLTIGRMKNMAKSISFIDVDNVEGAYNAVTHLIKHGHHKIAHVAGIMDEQAAIDRRIGYENALRDNNIPIQKELIVEGHFTERGGYSSVSKLLPYKPDAIFVASDTMAFGVVRAIKDAGLNVPKDIAVIGFDDLPPSQLSSPKLTTVRQPILQYGFNAVEILIDIINNGDQEPRHTIVDTELVIRDSCGANHL